MFSPNTTPVQADSIDYESAIFNHLHGTDHDGYSGFQVREPLFDLSLPSFSDIGYGIAFDVEFDRAYEAAQFERVAFDPAGVAECIAEQFFPERENTVIAYLQEDMHELFPNEKMWPHLDALAEDAAREYFNDLVDLIHYQADMFIINK